MSSRSNSQQAPYRPSSSLSRPSSAAGYNPGGLNVPQTPRVSVSRLGGLTDKEFSNITSTILSANKPSLGSSRHRPSEDLRSSYQGSVLAETSYTRAPLSSRLPASSPRRISGSQLSATGSGTSRPRPRIVNETLYAPRDDDSSSEGESLLESEEKEDQPGLQAEIEKRSSDKESLSTLGRSMQEAMIVEDLLFVLMGIEGQYVEFAEDYSSEDAYERLQGARFDIDSELDPSLAAVAKKVISIATHYTGVAAWADQYSELEHGVINHALCAAIREILREYAVLLAQLEHQFISSSAFTLQTLLFHLQSKSTTLEFVYSLTTKLVALSNPPIEESSFVEDSDDDEAGFGAAGLQAALNEMKGSGGIKSLVDDTAWERGIAKGGEVLSVISDLMEMNSGNPTALALYSSLLLRASQPYATILLGWISTGHLVDPWEEFIVREDRGITKGGLDRDFTDTYWDGKYTLRDAAGLSKNQKTKRKRGGKGATRRDTGLAAGAVMPSFLEKWKVKILLAGKYLNVIRECGIEIDIPGVDVDNQNILIDEQGPAKGNGDDDTLMPLNNEAFFRRIEVAYIYANKTLLKLLFEEKDLVSKLRSVKQYFFMGHGDSFTHFLDLASKDLGKDGKDLKESQPKIQALLDLALRNSAFTSSNDTFKDELRVKLEDEYLTDYMLKIVTVTGETSTTASRFKEVDKPGERDQKRVRTAEELAKEKKDLKAKNAKEKAFTGFYALTLDTTIPFPLSLVLSRKTITRYQMLFRHLLQLKHVERELTSTVIEHKLPIWRLRRASLRSTVTAAMSTEEASALYYAQQLDQFKTRVFELRSRMLFYIQQVYSFVASDVLEFKWVALEMRMGEIEMVDRLLKEHTDFLDTCLKECLLTHETLLPLHAKLLSLCDGFAAYNNDTFKKTLSKPITPEAVIKLKMQLLAYETNFAHYLERNLDRIRYHAERENPALLPLVLRLSSLKGSA